MCERFFFIFIPDKNRQKQFILQLFLLIVISGRYIYYYFWSKNVWCTKTISNTHTLKQFLGSVVSCNFGNCFYSIHPSYIRVELNYFYPLSYSLCLILPLTRGGICNMKYQVVCNTKLQVLPSSSLGMCQVEFTHFSPLRASMWMITFLLHSACLNPSQFCTDFSARQLTFCF